MGLLSLFGVGDKKKVLPKKSSSKPTNGASEKQSRSAPLIQRPVRISSESDIPSYSRILSSLNSKKSTATFKFSDEFINSILILELDEKRCALITTEAIIGTAWHRGRLHEIQSAGYLISYLGIADSGLISGFYANVADGDEGKPESAIIKDFDNLVFHALTIDASDIHIEVRDTRSIIKMRRHGKLKKVNEWTSREYASNFARTVFTIADADSKSGTFIESASNQLSVSRVMANGQRVKLRVQTLQAYPDGGFDIIMRVLRVGAATKVRSFAELGYAPHHIEMLDVMLSTPSGMVIIAGTTGSGKSTTLQSMTKVVSDANPHIKMISVEDPPEYILANVTQIPVVRRQDDKERSPFARTMRDTMRADPDVIIVGEVRDPESAECLVAIVQSGHKVLTTIHAENAFSIISRLGKMNVDELTLSTRGFISGLIYQKLVPVLCTHCKVPYSPELIQDRGLVARIKEVTRQGDQLFLASSTGCEHCEGLGVTGRSVCAEMVIPDKEMLNFFREKNPNAAFQYWRDRRNKSLKKKDGYSMVGMTALDHAIMKMRQGICSPEDVEAELGRLNGGDDGGLEDDEEDSGLLGGVGD